MYGNIISGAKTILCDALAEFYARFPSWHNPKGICFSLWSFGIITVASNYFFFVCVIWNKVTAVPWNAKSKGYCLKTLLNRLMVHFIVRSNFFMEVEELADESSKSRGSLCNEVIRQTLTNKGTCSTAWSPCLPSQAHKSSHS